VGPRSVRLTVADNGSGFVVEPDRAGAGGHWGLLGMRERMERLGGALTVASTPGKGVRLVADAPL
jgi:signal transduction histidine kinase